MPGRSLRLSSAGQQKTRQALVARNLTQKAIANELGIASWSTINKFFTGKPVDRFIFQEICAVLELDWQEVVQQGITVSTASSGEPNFDNKSINLPQPSSPSPANQETKSSLLSAVQVQSKAAREALKPRILEHIPRRVVREKYLGAIARGTVLKRERVIAIVGPAGYGKSTILGDIYDELLQASTPWVGLILCSSLSLSTGYRGFMSYGIVASTFASTTGVGSFAVGESQSQQSFIDAAIGQSLCSENRSVVAIATQLNETCGRGVLLIDTLDLVINRDFVIAFGTLLRQLLTQGTTVVFTCRDHEYNDYLEPFSQRLPGLTHAIDRYAVPNFSTLEIRAAAETFFRRMMPDKPERGKAFADNILALSADNRSLKDILENPLLLALLCDLFKDDGSVPPDLTVSKLYQRYWQEKVAYSRADQSHYASLAIEKENLCLQIAQRLFELSHTRLYESFYRDELEVNFTPVLVAAYSDLLSEGVLTQLSSGKLHFFHQTLLEYAIAYWLTRQSARTWREQLFAELQQLNTLRDRTYWLPVLRQLLAIVDEAEFESLVAQLDINHMGIFGAIAYAAVSRDRPDALRQLLPVALSLGENHQRRLRQALAASPRQLIENIWDLVLILLQEAQHVTAGNTAQMVGSLLERWWYSLHFKLDDTLQAIAARPSMPHSRFPDGYDDRRQLFGWLLQPCLPLIQSSPNSKILLALRQQIHLMGHGTVAGIIQCHALASSTDQQNLLRQLLQFPIPRYEDVKCALIDFVSGLLPQHLEIGCFPLGNTWMDILHQSHLDLWESVQVKAVGRWAARDRSVFQAILQDYLCGSPERLGRNLYALLESMFNGSGNWLPDELQRMEPEIIASVHLNRFSSLLPRSLAEYLSPDDQELLAQWFLPYMQTRAADLCGVLNVLADASPTARRVLEQVVDTLPSQQRQRISHQLLRFQPTDTHPPLNTFKKAEQLFLVEIYQRQATTNPDAIVKLIAAALGKSNDVAVAASQGLAQACKGQVDSTVLLPLLRSPFAGVRVNGLQAIASIAQSEPLSLDLKVQICTLLADEDSQTVSRHFFDLLTEWVRQHQTVPAIAIKTISSMMERTIEKKLFEGGMGRSLIVALKVIACSETETLDHDLLDQVVHRFLLSIHLVQIKNGESEMINMLCAMHRLNRSFLKNVVEQDFPLLLQSRWISNASAVIKAICKLEGSQAPLLNEIIQRYGGYSDVESLVLDAKGN